MREGERDRQTDRQTEKERERERESRTGQARRGQTPKRQSHSVVRSHTGRRGVGHPIPSPPYLQNSHQAGMVKHRTRCSPFVQPNVHGHASSLVPYPPPPPPFSLPPPFSPLQAINSVITWAVLDGNIHQPSQHLRPAKLWASCAALLAGLSVRPSVCLCVSCDCGSLCFPCVCVFSLAVCVCVCCDCVCLCLL